MANRIVTMLCSGFGLGFYIPGLLAANAFNRLGIPTEVLVFESFMVQDKMDHIVDSKNAYHHNFALANLSARMPIDIRQSIDEAKVNQLLERWEAEDRREFISLSGHWVYILDLYRQMMHPKRIHLDLLYVDSDLAPSWKSLKKFHPAYNAPYYDARLYDTAKMEIRYEIPVSSNVPSSFNERKRRLVVHGGGWGMGTYQSKIPELAEAGYGLDIVAYDLKEGKPDHTHRYWMNDPAWCAWVKGVNGLHEFPPYCEITQEATIRHDMKPDNHWLFDIASEAMAIVAKPGAGTLIDSLAAGIPLILLEPFGSHEQSNYELWETLGYGISYERWKESGFAAEVLESMHERIISRPVTGKNYVDHYCSRIALANG
ncbi:hypothetical protein FHS18_006307 [Paenibacillus phyllosphaerae]|uniref:UDP-glucuronosyltransferase n=1 Tax=Paenibacillus phyllosphaerae TaxID=274593 RepID=A0A7W5B4T8_9BACL|nr:UDP-glucuronosyltransferase [Paenibacillus phyllosphaerae]MBB3114189.1 hypothetical protein [Paenibacillus phyllosphaerae]